MFKSLKLATKISIGFGVILVIAILLGGFGTYNMNSVKGKSVMLAEEYVPEVQVANEIERHSLLTMYAIRGYGLSEDTKYLDEGRAELADLNKSLEAAKALADKSPHLVKLKGQIDVAQEHVGEYEQLVEETVAKDEIIDGNREIMDKNAAVYMTNANRFLSGQNEKMRREIREGASMAKLDERLEKITLINDIIDLGSDTRVKAFKSQALRDPAVMESGLANFPKMGEKFDAILKITYAKEDIEEIGRIKEAGANYKGAMEGLLQSWKELQEIGNKRNETGNQVLEAAQVTAKAGIEQTSNIANDAMQALTLSSTIMVAGLIAAVILGVALAWLIVLSITKPINLIVGNLNEAAEQVNSASSQLSMSSQQIAEGATEQASSLEETSSSLEEISSVTKQNADNATSANSMMEDTKQLVSDGVHAMKEMVEAMDSIKNSSGEISKIIKVIEEIAFQTNLLALNAAVEAARAGEHGKGFAVVAEEVRNLAQRSATASKDTAQLIENAVKKANDGSVIVNKASASLDAISESSRKVGDLVGEISAASREQSSGIDQVNNAVGQMDQVTQQNAANAEEAASASEQLAAQSETMRGSVNELDSLIHGGNGANGNGHVRKLLMHADHAGPKRVKAIAAPKVKAAVSTPREGKTRAVAPVKQIDAEFPMDDDDLKDF